MTVTPLLVKTLLEVFNEERAQLADISMLTPDEVKDILDCQDEMFKSGNDPLFWADGELIAQMVRWKRGVT